MRRSKRKQRQHIRRYKKGRKLINKGVKKKIRRAQPLEKRVSSAKLLEQSQQRKVQALVSQGYPVGTAYEVVTGKPAPAYSIKGVGPYEIPEQEKILSGVAETSPELYAQISKAYRTRGNFPMRIRKLAKEQAKTPKSSLKFDILADEIRSAKEEYKTAVEMAKKGYYE